MNIKQIHLNNNITLITQSNANSLAASIGFFFSTGSRYESENEYGISHFTEHLIFKGTKNQTNRQIACSFDKMGGLFNAYTERENVTVYCTIPAEKKENFVTALDTLCDLTENCSFPPEEIEKERDVVKNEIYAVEDDCDDSAIDEVARCIWPGQSLSRTITGTVDDVEKITREQIVDWYEKYFVHGELVVVATGKIFEEELIERLQKLKEHKETTPFYLMKHFDEKVQWQKGNFIRKAKFQQTQIFLLYPLNPAMNITEYCALQIFNSAAGDSITSRLFEHLREKSGLCYNVGSFYTTYENAGAWCAFVACEENKVAESAEQIISQIQGFLKETITDEEIEMAKERWCGNEILGDESSVYIMRRLWNFFCMGFDLLDTQEIEKQVKKLSRQDIENYITKLINKNNRTCIVYGPKPKHKIKKQLESIWQKM